MMLECIENGSLVYLTIKENGRILEKKYAELSEWKGFKMTVMFKQLTLFFKVYHRMCITLSIIGQSFAGTSTKENATSSRRNNDAGQTTIPHNAAFQTDDLDAYDSDCDDISSAKAVLMANLSSYDSSILSKILNPISKQPVVQTTPVRTEAPSELPKVSMVKTSFQKLKNHLASFDKVVKVRTTPDAIIEGSWGFEHTKAVFMKKVIPFIKTLRELFNDFDNGLNLELNEVKMGFNQMEAVVKHCSVDKKYFNIQKEVFFLDNDRLLEHIIS
nr:hypothetical protein [Tanacetum cinerariifolium]